MYESGFDFVSDNPGNNADMSKDVVTPVLAVMPWFQHHGIGNDVDIMLIIYTSHVTKLDRWL